MVKENPFVVMRLETVKMYKPERSGFVFMGAFYQFMYERDAHRTSPDT